METQGEAKRFFAAKVIAEAEHQGTSLSHAERRMLYWSESDPEFTPEQSLVEQLGRETSDDKYEAKICRLLHAVYRREVQSDPSIRDAYRIAYLLLKEGDHYIVVMIDRALARRLRPWWKFFWS